MLRIAFALCSVLVLLALPTSVKPASAQSGWFFGMGPDDDDDGPPVRRVRPGQVRPGYPYRSYRPPQSDDDDDDVPYGYAKPVPMGPKVADGGPRPSIAPIPPQTVPVALGQPVGTIVIDTRGRQLFLVTSANSALRYPISVGRDGFSWTGTEHIARIAEWPDWHPPAEMRERDPRLPEKMTGGLRNPLGAKALYLGNSLYRIHGTNDAKSIGVAASSGCFRMLNGHVLDLAGRVNVGTKVVVLSHIGARPRTAAAPSATQGADD